MLSEDVLYLPIRELGDRLRKRAISPVELTQSFLERSKQLGPKFNAYATLTEERALDQARAAEKEIAAGHYRGPLHGIPYAAKDLVAVKGYPTTWGAPPFADQKFDYDATVIQRLDHAGAILIGKAAMIELAGGLGYTNGNASLTGPAHNPWNTECWTCGSSSGSGAIVSAGLAPWAIGSDTRGSIICPTTWCGISGMRPSFGRVSRYGAMTIAWSMDKLGPMARTADCCGLALSVMAGHDPKDHDSLPPGLAEFSYPPPGASEAPLRIGRLTNAWSRMDTAMQSAIDDGLQVLEKAGAKVSDAALPDGPFEDAAELTILMEAASAYQNLVHSGGCAKLIDPLGQVNGYVSEEMSSNDYLQVQRVRQILQHRIDKLFDDFDVIATAGSNSTAQRLTPGPRPANQQQKGPAPPAEPRFDNSQRAPDGISSLCGLPALSVPCGFSSGNLPYGLQFLARATNDLAVIAAARKFQSLTDWHEKRPPIA